VVSVFCTAYNHEKYIARALESVICQKTNFPFELIVHDDASTDGTAAVIREYAARYPQIIRPIYQTENQYSKGIEVFDAFIKPLCRGKLKVTVTGGKLLGLGSACPYYDLSYLDDVTDTCFGEALAVIRAEDAENLTVTVSDGKLWTQAYVTVVK